MTKLLVIDTESGGLDPDVHSILSLAGVVWKDGEILSEYEVFIREDPYIVTAKALKINHINLVKHDKKAKPPADSLNEFKMWVWEEFQEELVKKELPVLVGHNIGFDIGMTKRLCRLANTAPFDKLFSHRSVDTASILRYLHLLGFAPESVISSTGGFKHFGIDLPTGERHTALGDARATAKLLTRMLDSVSSIIDKRFLDF